MGGGRGGADERSVIYRRDSAVDYVKAQHSTTTHVVTIAELEQLGELEKWPVITVAGLETPVLWGQLADWRLVLDALVETGDHGPSGVVVTTAGAEVGVEATFAGVVYRVVLDPDRAWMVTALAGDWFDQPAAPEQLRDAKPCAAGNPERAAAGGVLPERAGAWNGCHTAGWLVNRPMRDRMTEVATPAARSDSWQVWRWFALVMPRLVGGVLPRAAGFAAVCVWTNCLYRR